MTAGRTELEDFDFDRNNSVPLHLQDVGGGGGDVDDPAAGPGTAIVDAHLDAPPIPFIRDAHDGAERQVPMRRGKFILVEPLAAGRPASIGIAIPGGFPVFDFAGLVALGAHAGGGISGKEKSQKEEKDDAEREDSDHKEINEGLWITQSARPCKESSWPDPFLAANCHKNVDFIVQFGPDLVKSI
jgi:hypothetical protein